MSDSINLITNKDPIVMIYENGDVEPGEIHIVPFTHDVWPRMPVSFNWRVFMVMKNPLDRVDISKYRNMITKMTNEIREKFRGDFVKNNDKSKIVLPESLKLYEDMGGEV